MVLMIRLYVIRYFDYAQYLRRMLRLRSAFSCGPFDPSAPLRAAQDAQGLKTKNPPRWRRVCILIYLVIRYTPPPCVAGIITTTTIIIAVTTEMML
jgi:hypothetical protein